MGVPQARAAVALWEALEGRTHFDTVTFSSTTAITVPAVGTGDLSGAPADPYPTQVTVSGMPGSVSNVVVTLRGLTHAFPQDMDVLLVSPSGRSCLLMSDAGSKPVTAINLTFDDDSTSQLPVFVALETGVYRCTNYNLGDSFPLPGPNGGWSSLLATFDGTLPNGTWSLFVVDDAPGDTGTIAGWDLTITSDTLPPVVTDASFLQSLAPERVSMKLTKSVEGSLDLGDFVLKNLNTQEFVPVTEIVTQYDPLSNTASLAYNGLGVNFPDGNYRMTLIASGVNDDWGVILDGDDDGNSGGNLVFDFFSLLGDANHDRAVGSADFNLLATNFGEQPRLYEQGDFTHDQQVNSADFNVLASQFGKTLPAMVPPALSGIETTPLVLAENDAPTVVTSTIGAVDSDSANLSGAVIRIAGNYQPAEDVLGFVNTATITGVWDSVNGILTLTGVDTVAAYQSALRAVTYQNTSDNPSTLTRSVRFTVSDNDDPSNVQVRQIDVIPANDGPSLSGIESAPLEYTENDPAAAITQTLALADPDSTTLASAVVQITGNYQDGQDVLSFTNTANITGTWDSLLGKLTLTGTDSLSAYQDALRSVTYQNTSDTPATATRTISFTINDGSLDSATVTRDVTLVPVNDAPALAAIEPAPLAYIEGDPATIITETATIADADHADLSGATVRVRDNYVQGEDTLDFTNTSNISGSWDSLTGILTLTGVDTVAAYQAAIRSIRYANSSDNPSTLTRTIGFVVTDGQTPSAEVTRDISITPIGDAPSLAGIESAPLAFSENDPATFVTATLLVDDPDSATLSSAIMQITGNYSSGEDVLAFVNTSNITGSWNSTTGMLTLTGTDTLAAYEAALRSVTYQNTSDTPSTLDRTITFTVNDGSIDSAPVSRDVAITAVNDAPELTGIESAALAYTEADPPTAITATLAVGDVDSASLTGAIVQITTNYFSGEDVLAFVNTSNITGSWNSTTGMLTLTGTDTLAAYEAALRSVTYQNTSADPSTLTRTVSFSVNDGTSDSNIVARDIVITATFARGSASAGGSLFGDSRIDDGFSFDF